MPANDVDELPACRSIALKVYGYMRHSLPARDSSANDIVTSPTSAARLSERQRAAPRKAEGAAAHMCRCALLRDASLLLSVFMPSCIYYIFFFPALSHMNAADDIDEGIPHNRLSPIECRFLRAAAQLNY